MNRCTAGLLVDVLDLDRSRALVKEVCPLLRRTVCVTLGILKLKLGRAHEFKQRHDEIWREMRALLSEAGHRGCAIFQHEDTIIRHICNKRPGIVFSPPLSGSALVSAHGECNVGVGG